MPLSRPEAQLPALGLRPGGGPELCPFTPLDLEAPPAPHTRRSPQVPHQMVLLAVCHAPPPSPPHYPPQPSQQDGHVSSAAQEGRGDQTLGQDSAGGWWVSRQLSGAAGQAAQPGPRPRAFIASHFGGWTSTVKVRLAGPAPPAGCEGGCVPGLSPGLVHGCLLALCPSLSAHFPPSARTLVVLDQGPL